jgi:hypothetical protein
LIFFRDGGFQWQSFHFVDEIFFGSEYPPQETKEKQKEDDKGDNGPDSNVIYTLKNVLIHMRLFLIVTIISVHQQFFLL